jgi:hypothetical protein
MSAPKINAETHGASGRHRRGWATEFERIFVLGATIRAGSNGHRSPLSSPRKRTPTAYGREAPDRLRIGRKRQRA